MSNPDKAEDQGTHQIWSMLKMEIAGIQLLWEVIEGLTSDNLHSQKIMAENAPCFWGLTTAIYLESLISRVSRLMDPPATGSHKNISLARLATLDKNFEAEVLRFRSDWESSALDELRNKLLAHNDYDRFTTSSHTVNLPITSEDLASLGAFVNRLLSLRNSINKSLGGASVLNAPVAPLDCKPETVFRLLSAGNLFFNLLPENEQLQRAYIHLNA
jgi:hypothetical protein